MGVNLNFTTRPLLATGEVTPILIEYKAEWAPTGGLENLYYSRTPLIRIN
jgi:hypothetical protein